MAFLEFAFTLPIVLAIGGWGIELSNVALTNLKVSQYALNLADSASRVGQDQGSGVTDLRETDANDALQGARLEGASLKLTTYGRVTLSSLENIQQSYDTGRVQRVHWQRCIGMMNGPGYDSTYGTVSPSAGSDGTQSNSGILAPTGFGAINSQVNAPNDSGVMFVEINFKYTPLFGSIYLGSAPLIIHYVASYIVRDNRSFVQVYNPAPTAVASTCDKHNN